ncbi:MAG: family NAD(P)-dependent oxidoreductase [Rhizobium sp.]|nr:family NAD(P)-dependent oxidoreductase [Rhizobium sp.]
MSGHVVITGAAGGIGHALADGFLKEGWRVTGIDLEDAAIAHPNYLHRRADITDEPWLATVFAEAAARMAIDAVIANAAVTDKDHRPALELDYAVWQQVLRINVDGAFLTARTAARHMPDGGNIMFVTSSLAFLEQAKANDAPYCASKSAVEMLMRILALELVPAGINVNSIFPSVKIDSGFFAHLDETERSDLARPDILNAAALFLASLEPGALTGVSVDQQRWDDDPDYRAMLEQGNLS